MPLETRHRFSLICHWKRLALAGITQYGYDGPRPVASLGLPGGVDHLVSVTDPKSLITSYMVDGLDNQKQQVSPDTGTSNN